MKSIIYYNINAYTVLFVLLCFSVINNVALSAAGDMEISRTAGISPIVIKTCSKDAGAICSLKWHGKEFINDFDHGRQLQSASFFHDCSPDCPVFNPTEAGAAARFDGIYPFPQGSSSQLIGYWNTSNQLATTTRMAWWDHSYGQATSNHTLHKKVTIGYKGLAHVIEYLTYFAVPQDENYIGQMYEVVTGYMPPEFSKFWSFDPSPNNAPNYPLQPRSDKEKNNLPVIVSTLDQGWAMGVYSQNHPRPSQFSNPSYRATRFPDVAKWNTVFRFTKRNGNLQDMAFQSYVIVGSLENVRISMIQLYNKLH